MTAVWITVVWITFGNNSIAVIQGIDHVHTTKQSCEKMIIEVFIKSKVECRELKLVDITK